MATNDTGKTPAVFAAVAAVAAEIDKIGIAKEGEARGEGVNFKFRGIDATLDTFSGPLARANLRVLASYSGLSITERTTKNGGKTYHANVTGSYRAVSMLDGSELSLGDFYGEANDTQDKAIAKAQSIALRQCYLQTWSVPLGAAYDPESGDSDVDSDPPPAQGETPKAKPSPGKPVSGVVVEDLKPGQIKVIESTAKARGVSMDDVKRAFPKMNTGNLNDILAWIKNPKTDA